MAAIEAVVFDIGNVLMNWDPEGYYDRTFGRDRREELFAAVDLDGMNIRSDLGEDIADLTAETAALHPGFAEEILAWSNDWMEMAKPDVPGTATLLRALKERGMPVFALSNFGIRTLEMAETAYPVLTEFDRRYISGHLGMVKPDAAFYAHLETDSGVSPETILFTDDRPDNIEAAAARGWQVHLFEGPEGFAKRLVAEGLLTEEEAG
ncbi:HAD family phosphatase [Pseudoruegeria sp. HB172150]|uniref:HAD family hydrolase n=1 Tax=Pseudoruegeria sp. HB172150 TaxID=2721164 RepID=UPI0015580039|nr:HAD family phosphatase [Pseudoruegeria sp. HB172150]